MADESWLADLLGYREIYREGETLPYPQRRALLLSGSVTVEDDPAAQATRVTFAQPPGGSSSGSLGLKDPVRVATTASVSLSGLLDVDGVPLSPGDRVLVKDNTASENGIYEAQETQWGRALDAADSAHVRGVMLVPVSEGDANGNSVWMLSTDDPIDLGSTPLVFERVGSGDARSLRGVPLEEAASAPEEGTALVFAAGAWHAGQLRNGAIHDDAAVAVRKLAGGSNGQVLRTLNGRPAWSTLSQADYGESIITTPILTANQDNYAPAGWGGATMVRLTADAARTINGFAPSTVRRKLILNASAYPITLTHLASGQAAGNQISTTRTPLVLAPGEALHVVQDVTAGVWRALLEPLPPAAAAPSTHHVQRFAPGTTGIGGRTTSGAQHGSLLNFRPVSGGVQLRNVSGDDVVDGLSWSEHLTLAPGSVLHSWRAVVSSGIASPDVTVRLSRARVRYESPPVIEAPTTIGAVQTIPGAAPTPILVSDAPEETLGADYTYTLIYAMSGTPSSGEHQAFLYAYELDWDAPAG